MSGRMVKLCESICRMCKYRSGEQGDVCNYWNITHSSRIFVDGKMAYDPEYCDKFERGKRIVTDREIYIKQRIAEWPLGFNPHQE